MQLDWLRPVVGRMERVVNSIEKYAEIIGSDECYLKGVTVFNLKKR